jgi:uncharacterized oligopeptide transporter (OPT) family protein
VIGLVAGIALYYANLPSMMFGLGVYLPFYLSFTGALGALAKVAYDRVCAARRKDLSASEKEEAHAKSDESGLVVASGLLGGESVVGVIIALASVVAGLAG